MATNKTRYPVFDELEREAAERLLVFAKAQDNPDLCAKSNHFDWKYIDHLNLNRVHVCIICNTVVGTG